MYSNEGKQTGFFMQDEKSIQVVGFFCNNQNKNRSGIVAIFLHSSDKRNAS